MVDRTAEILPIIIPGPNRNLRKIILHLVGNETYKYSEVLAKLSQNTESVWIQGGMLTKGAFLQFCLVNKALRSIYVNLAQHEDIVVGNVVSVIKDASQCSNLEEIVLECNVLNTRLDSIAGASRELRRRGVDILVGGIQYNC